MRIQAPFISQRAALATLGFLLGTGLANPCLAMPDVIPPASIEPSLNGLNIAYLFKQDKVKIIVYVVSHEKNPVICDTEYQGGPDKQHNAEQTVMPGKAVSFGYTYARKTGSIIIQLLCVRTNVDTATTSATSANTSSSNSSSSNNMPLENDPPEKTKSVPPVEEIDMSPSR